MKDEDLPFLEAPVAVEVFRDVDKQRQRRVNPRPEADLAPRSVGEEHLGERRPVSLTEAPCPVRRASHAGENEGNVLADAEVVDSEIGAGAEVISRPVPPDGHLVGFLRLGVGEEKIGEDGIVSPVLQEEVLLRAESAE